MHSALKRLGPGLVRSARRCAVTVALCTLACGPGTAGSSGTASDGGSSGETLPIAEWFPGYYVAASQLGSPEGGSVADFTQAYEFRADHTVHELNVYCDGRPDQIRFVHDWRVSEQGTVEIVLREPLMPGGDVGDVYTEASPEAPPCGPHVFDTLGLERTYYAGRYCATNFQPGTGHGDHDYCDFVPCDERAKMCAEEATHAE